MRDEVRYLDRRSAILLSESAWEAGREKHGDRFEMVMLPDDLKFPVLRAKQLATGDYRVQVAKDLQGGFFLLDLSEEEYERLPSAEINRPE